MEASKRRRPGPPKAFDTNAALNAAMVVFWEKGFEGTSLTDLTEAMGSNRPSLYATFGDKHSLFRQTLDRFGELGQTIFAQCTAEVTARRFVERFLRGTADLYTDAKLPSGCFLIQSAMSTNTLSLPARREAAERRRINELAVRKRLERAGKDELPSNMTPAQLAAYLASVGNGLAIRSADGAKREDLYRIIDLALAFWPETRRKSSSSERRRASGFSLFINARTDVIFAASLPKQDGRETCARVARYRRQGPTAFLFRLYLTQKTFPHCTGNQPAGVSIWRTPNSRNCLPDDARTP